MDQQVNIAEGFKINSIVLYGEYAQINGTFVRSNQIAGGVPSLSFMVSLEEGKSLNPDVTYDFTLTPKEQPQPETDIEPEQSTS